MNLDNASLRFSKAKIEEESTRLRIKLEQVKTDFMKEKIFF